MIEKPKIRGTVLTHCNIQEFTAARKKLLDSLTSAVEKRFHEFFDSSANQSVILATRIGDLSIWPKTWETLTGLMLQPLIFSCFACC